MIQLKNVSKFYHSKGMISSGISRVNLELEKGEFVVITGESGSGKSTLLNVISGLDSYEEGEMYIDGQETSHYIAADFEEYRRKYIGNVFQNYNLINSYTVYQNIELILRINGYSKSHMKKRVNEIIRRVGLTAFRKTKVSKLSGGQKQRVAIARALAKDTDIIVADEPTGNLDSRSAEEIARLLSEIARDKLVVVVTHNYDQFAPYASRRIKMHDGKVVENLKLKDNPVIEQVHLSDGRKKSAKMTAGSKLRLGLRNTFNIPYKFVLLLVVFVFLVVAVASQYTTYVNQKEETEALGYNGYFTNYSSDRIVLKKKDGSQFTEADYSAIEGVSNVDRVAPNDILLDRTLFLENADVTYEAFPKTLKELDVKPDKGNLPESPNEIFLVGQKDDYSFSDAQTDAMIGSEFTVPVTETASFKVKVSGVAFDENTEEYEETGSAYISEELMGKMMKELYKSYSTLTTTINGKAQVYDQTGAYYNVIVSDKAGEGEAILSEDANAFYEKMNAKGHEVSVTAENIYYKETVKLKIKDIYTEKTFAARTGYKSFDEYGGAVFISQADYDRLFAKGNFQCSAFVRDTAECDATVKQLQKMGFTTLALKDALVKDDADILSLILLPVIIIILLAVFFIAYFVTRLILKSRAGYFGILRMLGLQKRAIRRILDVELFTVVLIAFAIFVAVAFLCTSGVIHIEYMQKLVQYMQVRDYVILYVLVEVMSLLISGRFARRIFRKTALGSFREEQNG